MYKLKVRQIRTYLNRGDDLPIVTNLSRVVASSSQFSDFIKATKEWLRGEGLEIASIEDQGSLIIAERTGTVYELHVEAESSLSSKEVAQIQSL